MKINKKVEIKIDILLIFRINLSIGYPLNNEFVEDHNIFRSESI